MRRDSRAVTWGTTDQPCRRHAGGSGRFGAPLGVAALRGRELCVGVLPLPGAIVTAEVLRAANGAAGGIRVTRSGHPDTRFVAREACQGGVGLERVDLVARHHIARARGGLDACVGDGCPISFGRVATALGQRPSACGASTRRLVATARGTTELRHERPPAAIVLHVTVDLHGCAIDGDVVHPVRTRPRLLE